MPQSDKTAVLNQIIAGLPPAAVAFSGGVDSSLLASVVYEVQGKEALALTIDSIFVPRSEIADAVRVAAEIGIEHRILSSDTPDDTILSNPRNRCYHCKKTMFGRLLAAAREMGREILLDGTNLDDLGDHRPGLDAVKELKIRSPLLEAELTKAEIRERSRQRGLSTSENPSMACLASRIPYGESITEAGLGMVEAAEGYLQGLGFAGLRVRKHGCIARIELLPQDRLRFIDLELMERVSRKLKQIGFSYVTLDLDGYRTGSLN